MRRPVILAPLALVADPVTTLIRRSKPAFTAEAAADFYRQHVRELVVLRGNVGVFDVPHGCTGGLIGPAHWPFSEAAVYL